MDICFAHDVTSSMQSAYRTVRDNIKATSTYLFNKISDLRIGIISFGDYCDGRACMDMLDFTSDVSALERYVNKNHTSEGGDSDECYEYALFKAKSLSWRDGPKALVMIGDCSPHPVGYVIPSSWKRLARLNFDRVPYDWKKEAQDLINQGVSIYPIRALENEADTPFYHGLATLNKEKVPLLKLANFKDINGFLTAITMAKVGRIAEFQKEVEEDGGYSDGIVGAIRSLSSCASVSEVFDPSSDKITSMSDKSAGFVVLDVKRTTPIKEFVENNGLKYKAGHGFYSIKNSTKVLKSNMDVVIMDKKTKEIKVPTSRNLKELMRDHKVFVQSKSYNRKLVGGSQLLYKKD